MATSNMKMSNDVAGFLDYCLYEKKQKGDKKKKEKVRRDVGTLSTFLNDERDIPALIVELKLYKGRTAEAIHERVSPSPEDMVILNTFAKQKQFFSECAQELHPNEPHFIILHGDSACGNVHAHIFFPWHYINLKSGAFAEGVRRQEAIDKVCRKWGLSVVERRRGELKQSRVRTPLSSVRAKDRKDKDGNPDPRYSWMTDIKERLDKALERADTAEQFEDYCHHMGVQIRFRGRGVSYSFTDHAGKHRVIRGKRLGLNYMVSRGQWGTGPKDREMERTPQKELANRAVSPARSAAHAQTGGAKGSRGGKGSAGVVTSSGRVWKSDKSWMDPVSREQTEAQEGSQEQALRDQEEANRKTVEELDKKTKKGKGNDR